MKREDKKIPKYIITGLLFNQQFTLEIKDLIKTSWLPEPYDTFAKWCLDYFKEHDKVPGENTELMFSEYLSDMDRDEDEDGLSDYETFEKAISRLLSNNLEDEQTYIETNLETVVKNVQKYFQIRQINEKIDDLKALMKKDDIEQDEIINEFNKPITSYEKDEDVFLANGENVKEKFKEALKENSEVLINYSGALGKFINNHLIRGGFVGFIAPEKAGKTWLMIDMMMKAIVQGRKVAFFQAGDMTEKQMLIRLGTYISKRPIKEHFSGERYFTMKDCIHNQMNTCQFDSVRETSSDYFIGDDYKKQMPDKKKLIEMISDAGTYKNCFNCGEYTKHNWGTVCLEKRTVEMISTKKLLNKVESFFAKYPGQFLLLSYPNNTLKPSMMKNALKAQEKKADFKPDIIFVDYADLMVPDNPRLEFRHQQNDIWKSLRGINQEINCLMVTCSQADAKSYKKNTLDLDNFSEDKRKYGHVTSMFSINHDKENIERDLKIMRLGNLLAREEEYSSSQVSIIQRFETGQPVYDSFNSYYFM